MKNNGQIFSYDVVFTALCVSEHIESLRGLCCNPIVEQFKEAFGSLELRDTIIQRIAPRIDTAYQTALAKANIDCEAYPYDLEFVPEIFDVAIEEKQTLDIEQAVWDAIAIKCIWLKNFLDSLQNTFRLSLNDIGQSPSDIFEKYGDNGDANPDEAVKEIGEKFNLDPVKFGYGLYQ